MAAQNKFSPVTTSGLSAGVDLVTCSDVAASIEDHGERYLSRLFSAAERAHWPSADQVHACAQSFAVKEAALKALNLADQGIDWRDLEVRWQNGAVRGLALHRRAAECVRDAGIQSWHVSCCMSGGMALAWVCGERPKSPDSSRMPEIPKH